MTDRPILFSAPMVRALLAGTKTQTRRLMKLPTKGEYIRPDMGGWEASTVGGKGVRLRDGTPVAEMACIWNRTTGTTIVPSFVVGDRLWVKETWRTQHQFDGNRPTELDADARVQYEAGPVLLPLMQGKTRVSIHMPRWASRLTLHVTDIRVQRLQDITPADCRREGHPRAPQNLHPQAVHDDAARDWYMDLWNTLNGAGTWDKNPWVCAITFTVERCNIAEAAP